MAEPNRPNSQWFGAPIASDFPFTATSGSAPTRDRYARALEPSTLANLREIGGDEFVDEINDEFINEADSYIHRLHGAVASEDAAALMHTAHTLKGSSCNVGAREITSLCSTLQEIGKRGTVEGAAHLANQVERAFEALRAALER